MKFLFLIALAAALLLLARSAQSKEQSSSPVPALPSVSILLGGIGTLLLLRTRS